VRTFESPSGRGGTAMAGDEKRAREPTSEQSAIHFIFIFIFLVGFRAGEV
jgi:hypothetical protein